MYSITNGEFTIELSYSYSVNQRSRLIALYASSTDYVVVIHDTSNKIQFVIYSNGIITSLYTNSTVPSGVFNKIALTFKDNTMHIFINGILDASQARTTGISSVNRSLSIGAYYEGSSMYFTGLIDEVRYTRNVARYTSSYDVATDEFPNQ